MEKEFPDLHHKMSKKIAQLTKVIYQLNTRNDDYESEIKSLADAHENEIEHILKDACRRLNEFQEDVNIKNEQIKQNKAIEVMQKLHDDEKKNFLAQFEKYKEDARASQEAISTKYETHSIFLTKDLESIKSQFISKIKEYTNTFQDSQDRHKSELERLQLSHTKEIQETEKRLSQVTINLANEKEKYTKLLEDQKSDLIDQFEKKAAEERNQFAKEKSSMETNISQHASATLQHQKVDFDAFVISLKASHAEELAKIRNENSILVQQHSEMEALIKEANDTIQRLEDTLQQEKTSNLQYISELRITNNHTISMHQNEMANLTTQLSQATARYIALEKEIERLNDETKEQSGLLNDQLTSKLDELNTLRDSQNILVNELQSTIAAINEDLRNTQRELKDSKEDAQRSQEDLQNVQVQLKMLVEEKLAQISTLVVLHEKESESWRSEIAALNEALSKKAEDVSNSMAIMKQLSQKHTEEVKDLKALYSKELSMKDSQISSLRNQLEELQRKASQLEKENESSTEKLRVDTLQYRKDSEKMRAEHGRQIFALETSIKNKENELKELQKQNANYAASMESMKALHEQTEKEAHFQLGDELESLKQRLDQEWREKIRAMEETIRGDMEKKYEKSKQDHINLLAQKDQTIATLENSASNLRRNVDDYDVLAKNQNSQVEQLNQVITKMEREKADALLQSDQAWTVRMNQAKLQMEDEIKRNEKMNEELVVTKQKEWEASVTSRMQSLSSYHDKLVTEMVAVHKKNMTTMSDQLDAKWTAEMLRKEKDRQRREEELLRSTKKEKDMALANLREENKQELRPFQTSLETKNAKIRDLENKLIEIQTQLRSAVDEVNKSSSEKDGKNREIAELKDNFLGQIQENNEKWLLKIQQTVSALEEEYRNKINDMNLEFNNSQQLIHDKCASLQQQLVAADFHYKNRSPREQDLDVIRGLRAEIAEYVDVINKMKADQKFMRLELQNREESFNKIFNKSPQVASPPSISNHKSYDAPKNSTASSASGSHSPSSHTSSHTSSMGSSPKLPPLSARADRTMSAKSPSPKNKF